MFWFWVLDFDAIIMADRSNVRLVRCPKCENLLQEFPDFSVYQCGGCGTVLRGKLAFPLYLFSNFNKVFFFFLTFISLTAKN